jgi:hypothetical protein
VPTDSLEKLLMHAFDQGKRKRAVLKLLLCIAHCCPIIRYFLKICVAPWVLLNASILLQDLFQSRDSSFNARRKNSLVCCDW